MKQGVGIFTAVIVILGMTGIAYAHWSETLYISGTVKTGELNARWSAGPSWDTEPPEKDVSFIECYLDPEDETGHTLIVEVKNAYPSIHYYQLIDLHNTGTIPLHVWSVDIDDGEMPDGTTIEILDVDDVDIPDEFQDYVTSDLDIEPCEQIHPGETAYGVIHVHLPQSAGQGAEYSFSATLITVQWNEGCQQEDDAGEGNSSDSEDGSDQSGSDSDSSSGDNGEDGGTGEGDNPGSSDDGQSGAGDNSDDSNSADDDRDTEATDGQSEAENNDDSSGSEENEGGESGADGNQATSGASGNEEGGESDTGGETGQSEQSGTESGTDDGNSGSGSDEGNDLGSTDGGEEGNSESEEDGGRFSAEGDGSGSEDEDKSTGSGETGDGTGVAKDDGVPVVGYVGSEQGVLAAGLVAVLIVLLITVFIGFMKPRKRS
ncbi:MAG: hypothetical protein DRN83_03420 [Hadesarchaea archaeon]|nr:MAG: hypothetical protein DRN83_03420 [Hadesarchaea archaeon]